MGCIYRRYTKRKDMMKKEKRGRLEEQREEIYNRGNIITLERHRTEMKEPMHRGEKERQEQL